MSVVARIPLPIGSADPLLSFCAPSPPQQNHVRKRSAFGVALRFRLATPPAPLPGLRIHGPQIRVLSTDEPVPNRAAGKSPQSVSFGLPPFRPFPFPLLFHWHPGSSLRH